MGCTSPVREARPRTLRSISDDRYGEEDFTLAADVTLDPPVSFSTELLFSMKTFWSSQRLSGGTGDMVQALMKGSSGSCAMGGAYLTAENLKSYKFTAYQVHQ